MKKERKGTQSCICLYLHKGTLENIQETTKKLWQGEIKVDRESAGLTFHYSWCAVAIVELVNYVNIL